MFVKRYIILQLCALCAHMAFSQATADTMPKIKAQNLPSVSIWSYSPIPSYTRTTNLAEAILRNKSNTLTDILQENTGIYLKNYGPGMLSTIAFRGTGAEHTALVWNGININYPMLGLADFATIPVNGFSSLMLVHGSGSNLFGSSAIGGAVVIGNQTGFTTGSGFNNNGVKTTSTLETGSFNRLFGSVTNYIGTKKFNSRTALQWFSCDNDFRFVNEFKFGKPVERQINSGLKQYALMQDFDIVTGQRSYLSVKGWYNITDRHIPPTLTSANSKAKQKDESIRIMGEWKVFNGYGNTNIRAAYVHDYIGFDDNYVSSKANISTTTLQANHVHHFANYFTISGGAEGQYFTANIKEYKERKNEWRASVYATLEYKNKRLTASAGYRQILVQGNITTAAPTMGASYNFIATDKALFTGKASISRSFRIPTLNERYWVPGGNPDLKPEGSWNYELGAKYEQQLGKVKLATEVTGFAMQVNNWLQWQPTNFGYWEPKNLKQVLSRGTEATLYIGYVRKKFEAKLNVAYALAIATNQKIYNGQQSIDGRDLIYTPRNVASGGLTLSLYGYSLFTNIQYTGLRYTTTDNSQTIDGYILLNTRASKDIKLNSFTLSIWVQVLNVTNNSYFNLLYRPMPLRNYKAGLTMTFEKELKNNIHYEK